MWAAIQACHQPRSSEEAVEIFHRHRESAAYLAGGTHLIPHRITADRRIRVLIDLCRLPLAGIEVRDEFLRIGSIATLQSVLEAGPVRGWAGGMVAEALRSTRSWSFRHGATLGGVIAAGDPLGEVLPALAAADARLELAGLGGPIPLHEFLARREEHVGDGTLILAVLLPARWRDAAGAFLKLARLPSDLPILTAAVVLRKNGIRCEDLRIALGGASPYPLQLQAVEASLRGKLLANTLIQQAVQPIPALLSPPTDPRATAPYRLKVAPVLVRRAIERCTAGTAPPAPPPPGGAPGGRTPNGSPLSH